MIRPWSLGVLCYSGDYLSVQAARHLAVAYLPLRYQLRLSSDPGAHP